MPDFTQIQAGEKKEVKPVQVSTEQEKQTKLLTEINAKLGFMQFVLILYIILSILGLIFG